MRLCNISQCITLIDIDSDLAAFNHAEQFSCHYFEIVTLCCIRKQGWTCNEQRPSRCQFIQTEGRNGSGCTAKTDHHAKRREAVERPGKCILANRVVHYRDTFAIGKVFDALNKVVSIVIDRVRTTICLCQRRLLIGADCADHRNA